MNPAHFYEEDIVSCPGSDRCAIVIRSWNETHEDDTLHDPPPLPSLKRGEVEISEPHGLYPEVVDWTSLTLLDRQFISGETVRDNATGVMGVVLRAQVEVQLQGALTGRSVPNWMPLSDLASESCIARGDVVAAENWVGIVEEVLSEGKAEGGPGGTVLSLSDMDGLLSVGLGASEIQEQAMAMGATMLPSNFSAGTFDRIVDMKQLGVVVNWIAINQLLPESERHIRRPKYTWTNLNELVLVSSASKQGLTIGDRVVSKNAPFFPNERFYVVVNRRSTVEVLWPDASVSSVPATSLDIAEVVDFEHDCWPGQVAVWRAEDESKVAVVSKVDPKRRIAEVRWWGSDDTALVSALELDPLGKGAGIYGVRWGELVLISAWPTRATFPEVPQLGEPEVRDQEERLGLREDLYHEAFASPYHDAGAPRTGAAAAGFSWAGTVVELHTDGSVSIQLPSGEVVTRPHDRLVCIMDREGQLMALEHGVMDTEEEDGEAGWQTDEGASAMSIDEIGAAKGSRDEKRGWADSDDEDEAKVEGGGHETQACAEGGDEAMLPIDEPSKEVGGSELPVVTVPRTPAMEPAPSVPALVDTKPTNAPTPSERPEEKLAWEPFATLEEAPKTHYYQKEEAIAPPRAFLSRLRKEYSVFESSLPGNILVRAYEDRTDLLRACIIGSKDTPYEDAWFLFDLYLPPNDFPQEPPRVFFYSWTNGGGRIQPNLYEEGRVCLSILGTWKGDSNESWSAQNSSILQVLVSISGLCLTPDPYFNEPGYERHRGTASGKIAAHLYSERAYVLTRGFVRHALTYPILGFEEELKTFYFGQGKLASVLSKARGLIAESDLVNADETKSNDDVASQGVLTAGAAIPLKRVVAVLEKLAAEKAPVAPA